ncbi:MAG: P-II family nitrogen regulator [Enterobacterales bacterium]|nr:P-II family nitrogen regulator [Enterobacterales bacterium]
MKYIKINAFVPILGFEQVEEKLKESNVPGITISKVKGYGKHMNFYSTDWLDTHVRIEVFCSQDEKDFICQAIKAGISGLEVHNGFVTIQPVQEIFFLSELSAAS